MTTKRFGVYICSLVEERDEYSLWSKPLPSNYYVMKNDEHVAFISSGPKSHFHVSIFHPHGGGYHYSYTTEHSDVQNVFSEIMEKIRE